MTSDEHSTVVTGATGFVGSMVLERLIAQGTPVTALIRAADDDEARRRLEALAELTWGDRAVVGDVRAVAADIEREHLGLPRSAYDAIAAGAAAIVHCAASVRFDLPLEEARSVNVDGTERIVALAERARSLGAAARLVHVSTAYVHGRGQRFARESGPSATPRSRNSYEVTKLRAERVVERVEGAAIVRPSIIVGDSRSGWTSSFNVVYVPLRALISGVFDVVPVPPDALIDLVAVDQVVDVICGLLDAPQIAGVVQAVSGDMAPTMEQLARMSLEHVGRPMLPCVSSEIEQIGVYAPYADVRSTFEFRRAGLLGARRTPMTELVPRLLDHALAADWGRRPVLRPSPLPVPAVA